MSFTYNSSTITLQGSPIALPTSTSFHYFKQFLHVDPIASLHLLSFSPISIATIDTLIDTSPSFSNLPSSIENLLSYYLLHFLYA